MNNHAEREILRARNSEDVIDKNASAVRAIIKAIIDWFQPVLGTNAASTAGAILRISRIGNTKIPVLFFMCKKQNYLIIGNIE